MTSILELEEAQGMSAEMIRAQMEVLGHPLQDCRNYPVCPQLGKHTHHGKGTSDFIVPDSWDDDDNQWPAHNLRASLQLAATMAGLSIQGMLRQINPRMREGEPSDDAKTKHEGLPWLSRDEMGNPRVGWWTKRMEQWGWEFYVQGRGFLKSKRVAKWRFWPGNRDMDKVRWPTDEHGAML